jgi:hypothetical protein
MSKPEGPGMICANVVNAVHSGHGGLWNAMIMIFALDQARALQNSQSPVEAVTGR